VARYVVCSAWPYVNNVPHLGTILPLISADMYARFQRMRGHDVVYVTGSDEHGTPIEVDARKKGLDPAVYADMIHRYNVKLFEQYGIKFSLYSRTESPVHKKFVQEFWAKIYENGYIFTQEDVLPYCPNCKMFLPDRFVEGTCPYCGYEHARGDQCENCGRLLHPTQLINPRCVFCGATPIFKSTLHWFFDLPRLEDKVREWLGNHPAMPENVKKAALNWMGEGLKPRSVTRDNKWGIPAPFPGAEGKTIYVWFDALLGYISATKEYFMKSMGDPEKWKEYWMNRDTKTVFFMGKDNIPFHAIIFPAMLMATHEPYVLPWMISATEYILYGERQFSKSRGIGVWADEALEIAPPDYWRFVLARLRPESKDISFTWKEFQRIIDNELNDDIGNFVHRVLSFIYSRYNGVIPRPGSISSLDKEFENKIRSIPCRVAEHMEKTRIKAASETMLELPRAGNQYLNAKAPWDAYKRDPPSAATTMWLAANAVKSIALMLSPFMPSSAQRLWEMLGMEGRVEEHRWEEACSLDLKPGRRVLKPKPLFKKLPKGFLGKAEDMLEEARRRVSAKRPPVLQ